MLFSVTLNNLLFTPWLTQEGKIEALDPTGLENKVVPLNVPLNPSHPSHRECCPADPGDARSAGASPEVPQVGFCLQPIIFNWRQSRPKSLAITEMPPQLWSYQHIHTSLIIWFVQKRNCVYVPSSDPVSWTHLVHISGPGLWQKIEAETIFLTLKQDQNTDMSSLKVHSNHRCLRNLS